MTTDFNSRPVPPDHYDVPEKHSKFWLMAQGEHDYVVAGFPQPHAQYGVMLVIATEEGAIYVTKEQAKAFFGLTEEIESDGPWKCEGNFRMSPSYQLEAPSTGNRATAERQGWTWSQVSWKEYATSVVGQIVGD